MSLFFYLVLDFSNKNTNKFCVGFVVFLKMFTYFQKNYKTRAQFLFSFNWGGEALSPFVLTLLCVHDSRCKDVHIRVTKRCRWFQEGYLKCRFPLLKLKCQNVFPQRESAKQLRRGPFDGLSILLCVSERVLGIFVFGGESEAAPKGSI